MPDVGLLILAAGASVRMGRPKQLLRYQGQTLLRRAAETALASCCRPVVVVLGAYVARMRSELDGLPVRIAENPDWEQGMGSSLRAGMNALLDAGGAACEALVVMLCDQPLLSARTLDALVDTFRASDGLLIASEYDGILGVPALFPRALFPELLTLEGAEGAKKVLRKHRDAAIAVPFLEGILDLDTPGDYDRLCARDDTEPSVSLDSPDV